MRHDGEVKRREIKSQFDNYFNALTLRPRQNRLAQSLHNFGSVSAHWIASMTKAHHEMMDGRLHVYMRDGSRHWQCSTFSRPQLARYNKNRQPRRGKGLRRGLVPDPAW